jgi:N-acetylneuraminate lyase
MVEEMNRFQGIIPAAVTPFDEQERFVPSAFEVLLENLYAAGIDGVYVCGGTGEGLLQTVDQRKQVAEVAVKNSPAGKPVIVHVGSHRTADAVELAQHAGKIGATAISALPPLGSYSFPEIRRYYEAIAAAADVPLLVYFFPDAYPGVRTADQALDLCTIPNVAGLKYTDFDLYRLHLIKQSGAVVFNGRDEVLTAGLLMGADGGIGTFYNVIPELFVDVYQLAKAGDWAAARAVQDQINTVVRITLQFPCFPAIKEILRWRGIDCGPCIRPHSALTPAQAAELRRQIEACGVPLLEPVSRTVSRA